MFAWLSFHATIRLLLSLLLLMLLCHFLHWKNKNPQLRLTLKLPSFKQQLFLLRQRIFWTKENHQSLLLIIRNRGILMLILVFLLHLLCRWSPKKWDFSFSMLRSWLNLLERQWLNFWMYTSASSQFFLFQAPTFSCGCFG